MDEQKKHVPVTRVAADARAENADATGGIEPAAQVVPEKQTNTPWGGLAKDDSNNRENAVPAAPEKPAVPSDKETEPLTVSKPRMDDLPQATAAQVAPPETVSTPATATPMGMETPVEEAGPATPPPASAASAKANAGGTNLAALRDRVLHESTDSSFHAKATTAQGKVTSAAEERAAKLEKLRALEGREATVHTPAPGIDPIQKPKEKPKSPEELKAAAVQQAMAENAETASQTTPTTSTEGAEPSTTYDASRGVRAVRTYKMDLSDAMEHQQTSVTGAIASEEVRRSKTATPYTPKKSAPHILGAGSYFLLGMSTVLVLVTVGLLFYFFVFLGEDTAEVAGKEVPTFFFTDAQEEIDVTGRSRIEFMDRLVLAKEKTNVQLGAITHLYVTETSVDDEGQPEKEIVSASDFLFKLDVRAPGKLYRAINDEMMLGVYEFDGNQPFLVFKTNSFDNAYAGMLGWERTMNADLTPLFGPLLANPAVSLLTPKATSTGIANATSTATSSDATSTSTVPVATSTAVTVGDSLVQALTFENTFISNREVRVLRDSDDTIALLWAFPDRQTLIIATDPATLEQVVNRLNAREF